MFEVLRQLRIVAADHHIPLGGFHHFAEASPLSRMKYLPAIMRNDAIDGIPHKVDQLRIGDHFLDAIGGVLVPREFCVVVR